MVRATRRVHEVGGPYGSSKAGPLGETRGRGSGGRRAGGGWTAMRHERHRRARAKRSIFKPSTNSLLAEERHESGLG